MTCAVNPKPRYCVISNDGLLAGPIQQFEQNQYWISTAWGTFSTKTKFAAVSPVGNIKIVYQGGTHHDANSGV
jgi:hypothetical protein